MTRARNVSQWNKTNRNFLPDLSCLFAQSVAKLRSSVLHLTTAVWKTFDGSDSLHKTRKVRTRR
jgi:hypothetical protein